MNENLQNGIRNDKNMEAISDYRKQAIRAAKDLFYSDESILKIKKAKTVGEIERIMRNERMKQR